MSQENVEIVRRSLEYYLSHGEPDWGSLDEDVVIFDHDIVDAGEYRGHAGHRRWLSDWAAAWTDFEMELEDYVDAGDVVVTMVRMSATGRGSGATVRRDDAIACRLRDGRIVRIDYYNDREQALRDAGVSAS